MSSLDLAVLWGSFLSTEETEVLLLLLVLPKVKFCDDVSYFLIQGLSPSIISKCHFPQVILSQFNWPRQGCVSEYTTSSTSIVLILSLLPGTAWTCEIHSPGSSYIPLLTEDAEMNINRRRRRPYAARITAMKQADRISHYHLSFQLSLYC